MPNISFAAMRRSLTSGLSRRGLLAGLAATAMTANALDLEAKRKGKRKKRKKRNKKDQPQNLPQVRADAQCESTNGEALNSPPDGRIAQTFTAIQSGELVRADLEFIKPTGTLGDFILHLAPVDNFGIPTNEVLSTAVLPSTVPAPGQPSVNAFTFPTPARVVSGTQYALVLSRPEVGVQGWIGRLDNRCDGRAFISNNRTSPFIGAGQEVDLVFATFVRS